MMFKVKKKVIIKLISLQKFLTINNSYVMSIIRHFKVVL